MQVIVMYRNNWFGGDGWTYYGEPFEYRFCEDGEWFTVHKWENPCGHIDYYKACLIEADELKEFARFNLGI